MQQLRISLKSFDSESLLIARKHIFSIARVLNIVDFQERNKKIPIKRIYLPKKIKKITVIRSPHIDKKSREQFEIRHHKNVFIFNIEKRSSALLFFECLKNSQIYGVELSVNVGSNSFYSM